MEAAAHTFLEGFTPAGRRRLLGSLAEEKLSAGAYLFHEGDAADGVYLILDGEVEIVRAAGTQEKVLGTVAAGDYLGEVAVLDGHGRSTAARARSVVEVAKIPRATLLEVLATEPGTLTLALFRHVLAHLRSANDMVIGEIVRKEKLGLVGEMAGSLMHDLRNPVTSIRLSADLIAMTHADVEQWCTGIRLQCDRLVAMATELLDFSRGVTKLEFGRVSAQAFLEQFRALNENYLTTTHVDIQYGHRPGFVEIDSLRMQRVLQNLVTNAVEALFDTPKPQIKITARVASGTFHLTVADNGPGIPPEIQDRLFEPFVTHGKAGGTGLGMAIVRNIVTAHGGTITFETKPGKGTKFAIALPQNRPAAASTDGASSR